MLRPPKAEYPETAGMTKGDGGLFFLSPKGERVG